MNSHRKLAGGGVATVVMALALAGCGSSGSSAEPSSGAKSTATGSPITVFAITVVDSPQGTFPGVVSAMKAAATTINAKGGVKGHPLVVQSCNTQFNPNQEVACARQAAASKAIAVVAPFFVTNAAGGLAVLKDAGLADLAGPAATLDELQSPIAFPLDAGSFTPATCLGLVKGGLAKKLATVVSDIGAIKVNAEVVAKAAPATDVDITTQITLPPTTPDVTSQIQQVANSGADGVVMFATGNQAAQVLQASAQLGKQPAFCTSDGLLSGGQLKTLGPAAGSVYVAATMPPPSAAGDNPAVASFVKDMNAELATGDKSADISSGVYSSTSMRAWAGMQALAQVAGSISGDITRASFLTALRSATDVDTGIFPPINFTKPEGGPAFPSLYNTKTQLLKWNVAKAEFVTTNVSFDVATTLAPPS